MSNATPPGPAGCVRCTDDVRGGQPAVALGDRDVADRDRRLRRSAAGGDADVVDAHPFVAAGGVGRDDADLQLDLILRRGREHHVHGRLERRQARARRGIGDEAGRHVRERTGRADAELHRDRLHGVVGRRVDVAQPVAHADVRLPGRPQSEKHVRRVGSGGPLERDRRVGDAVELRDAAVADARVRLVGDDVEVGDGRARREQRLRVDADARRDVLAQKALNAEHAGPGVVRGDERGVGPRLAERQDLRGPVGPDQHGAGQQGAHEGESPRNESNTCHETSFDHQHDATILATDDGGVSLTGGVAPRGRRPAPARRRRTPAAPAATWPRSRRGLRRG